MVTDYVLLNKVLLFRFRFW